MAQHWGRIGANLSENEGVRSECKKFGENSIQMAPVSTICDEYCSQDTQSTTVQSVANVVNASLAENTQGTPPRSENIFKTHSVNLRFKTSFFPKIVTGPFNTRHHR